MADSERCLRDSLPNVQQALGRSVDSTYGLAALCATSGAAGGKAGNGSQDNSLVHHLDRGTRRFC
jgi:hypothetical protein